MQTDNRTASPAATGRQSDLDPWLLDDDVPAPRDLKPAVALMERLGYLEGEIREAVVAFGMFGTAQCASVIDDEDRDAIESLLPRSAFWDAECWDNDVYMINN